MRGKNVAQRLEDETVRIMRTIANNDYSILPDIYGNLHTLIFSAAYLESDWCTEHDERVRLEERLKMEKETSAMYKAQADEYYELWQSCKE